MTTTAIHILDTEQEPKPNTHVTANCGKELIFVESIAASWDDGRVCSLCLVEHRNRLSSRCTFAFLESS